MTKALKLRLGNTFMLRSVFDLVFARFFGLTMDDGRSKSEEIENENIHTITEVEYVPQFARYIGSLFSREKQIQRIFIK